MSTLAMTRDSAQLVRTCHALADEKRLQIVDLLRRGERCVCELTAALDVGQSLLSFHLRVLKDAGVVTDRREGRWAFYTLAQPALEELSEFLLRPTPEAGACCSDGSCE